MAAAGVISGVSAQVGQWMPGAAQFNSAGVMTKAPSFAHLAVTGGAAALAGAATRSAITGTGFGDNIMRVLPDVIGSTIGNTIAGALQARAGAATSDPAEDWPEPDFSDVQPVAIESNVEGLIKQLPPMEAGSASGAWTDDGASGAAADVAAANAGGDAAHPRFIQRGLYRGEVVPGATLAPALQDSAMNPRWKEDIAALLAESYLTSDDEIARSAGMIAKQYAGDINGLQSIADLAYGVAEVEAFRAVNLKFADRLRARSTRARAALAEAAAAVDYALHSGDYLAAAEAWSRDDVGDVSRGFSIRSYDPGLLDWGGSLHAYGYRLQEAHATRDAAYANFGSVDFSLGGAGRALAGTAQLVAASVQLLSSPITGSSDLLRAAYFGRGTQPAVSDRVTTDFIGAMAGARGAVLRVGGATRLTGAAEGASGSLPKWVFRGDDRLEDDVFQNGFSPRGDSIDVLAHALNNTSPPSNYVSTSRSADIAWEFGDNVYVIRPPNGIDVNRVLGSASPHPRELEIVVQGTILSSEVRAVTRPNQGISILNPNYEPR